MSIKEYTFTKENKVYPKDEQGHTSVFRYYVESVDTFNFSTVPGSNDLLTVSKNGVSKIVYIEDCGGEYVYKCMKAKIKARGGANGLFDFMKKAFDDKFMDCCALLVLNHAIDKMTPAKSAAVMS